MYHLNATRNATARRGEGPRGNRPSLTNNANLLGANTMKDMLSQEEYDALRRYADEHGRRWKRDLRMDWMYARTEGELHRLRTSRHFGPSGLDRFHFAS